MNATLEPIVPKLNDVSAGLTFDEENDQTFASWNGYAIGLLDEVGSGDYSGTLTYLGGTFSTDDYGHGLPLHLIREKATRMCLAREALARAA